MIVNEIKAKVPKDKQKLILRRMDLEETVVQKVQKALIVLLGKLKTAPGGPKESKSKNVKKKQSETEKRVTRGSLYQGTQTSDKVSNSNDDGEDDEDDQNEDKRRKKKVQIAPLSSDTSSEETGSDQESDVEEEDGEYLQKRFVGRVFVHNSIQKPKLKAYWCRRERMFQTKTSNDPPSDGFVWTMNRTFSMKKSFAPSRKFNPSTRKTNKFRKYTWGQYQIDKKYVCSEEGCPAKKVTTKPEHYKGKTLLYRTIYKRLHNHGAVSPCILSSSKRNRDSSNSIEETRKRKKDILSKRKLQSSSSKGESSSHDTSKKKPKPKRRKELPRPISKEFSDSKMEGNNSSKDEQSNADILALSDSLGKSFQEISEANSTPKEATESLSESFRKILEGTPENTSAKETTISPLEKEKIKKKKKKDTNIVRLTKKFITTYDKKNKKLFESSESSDSSDKAKAKAKMRIHVDDVYTQSSKTSSGENSDNNLSHMNPRHKSTPILSEETDEDAEKSDDKKPSSVETDKDTMVNKPKVEEKSTLKNVGIGPRTQELLLEAWSQDPEFETLKSAEDENSSSLPGKPQHKSTPINSSKLTEDQSSQGQSKQSQPSEKNKSLIEDLSQKNTSIEHEEENARKENLSFVERWNENSQFNLSPPNQSDIESDHTNQTENQQKQIEDQSMRLKLIKNQQNRLADLSISDEAYENYRHEVAKMRKKDENLAVKTFKCLSKKIQFYKEPWKMDQMTPADDECFFHAIIQQAKREEIRRYIHPPIFKALLEKGDSLKLRQYIVRQMESNIENEELVDYRKRYTDAQKGNTDGSMIPWKQLCERMLRRSEWGDEHVTQATAFLLGMDIAVTTMNSDPARPTIIHRSPDDSPDSLTDPFLILGKIIKTIF